MLTLHPSLLQSLELTFEFEIPVWRKNAFVFPTPTPTSRNILKSRSFVVNPSSSRSRTFSILPEAYSLQQNEYFSSEIEHTFAWADNNNILVWMR